MTIGPSMRIRKIKTHARPTFEDPIPTMLGSEMIHYMVTKLCCGPEATERGPETSASCS